MSVYTKKGDKGTTSFLDKKIVKKSDTRAWAIGSLDEVNSWLGVVASGSEFEELNIFLKEIQRNIFLINSILAGKKGVTFGVGKTKKLEREIDRVESVLPKLTNFIVPGGGRTASELQFARTLVRRAERYLSALSEEEKVKKEILMYVNRLSDMMFMFSRETNFKMGAREEIWKGTSR